MADGGLADGRSAVVLLDDEEIWVTGVRTVLQDSEFVVVGEPRNPAEALELVSGVRPRMVLASAFAIGTHLARTVRCLRDASHGTDIIVLSASEAVALKAEALAGGAAAFLPRTVSCERLLAALRQIVCGERLLTTQDLARSPRLPNKRECDSAALRKPLTKRELEVLHCLATGLPNSEIAAILFVARSTIKTHVENIIAKLGVSNRIEAVSWAAQYGLTRSPLR